MYLRSLFAALATFLLISPSFAAEAAAPGAAAPEAKASKPAKKAKKPKPAGGVAKTAVIELEKGGQIELEFFSDVAPNTVENFAKLAEKGFYNGVSFHRVESNPDFSLVQGGDPNGNGSGGPGYTIKAEFNARKHLRGTIAMARTPDPDSAGSQFYICRVAIPQLDNQYTVFAQVTKGMDLVDQIKVGDKMKKVTVSR